MDPTTDMGGSSKCPSPATIALFLCTLLNSVASDARQATLQDPLKQPVPPLQLVKQTVVDGVAQLSQITTDVPFAVEFPLGRTISDPAPALTTVVARLPAGTLDETLDRMCDLDRTFSWRRIGNTVNVFPRALENDQTYLLNRRIDVLEFKGVPGAQEAVFDAIAQLAGMKQQIAVLQTGTSLGFSRPWSASSKDITVRGAFDKIAEQLGPTYGWQFGGAADFRLITFHQRLFVKPRASEPPS